MTEFPSTVLLTGAGGDIGASVARIFRRWGNIPRIIGCDFKSDHRNQALFDVCHTLPRADAPEYADNLAGIIASEGAGLVVPLSDAEAARFLSDSATESVAGVPVAMPSAHAVAVGLDKLRTAEFLNRHGLPHPWTVNADLSGPKAYPCIFKPRSGQGSKGLHLLQHPKDLEDLNGRGGVFQQALPGDEGEYTCGLYCSRAGEVRSITFLRELQSGLTGRGETVAIPAIDVFLQELGKALELRGAINVQLRLVAGTPVTFEINPRFSSTVGFRDLLGFCDLRWSVQEVLGFAPDPWLGVRPGLRFERGPQGEIIHPTSTT